jgi:hypothetical protein
MSWIRSRARTWLAGGERGEHGVVRGEESAADIQSSGDDLSMFIDGELDSVVSIHLGHDIDLVKTLGDMKASSPQWRSSGHTRTR